MVLNWIRNHFHPLWHLRKIPVFRRVTRDLRLPVGVHIKRIDHKVYVDFLRNPGMVGAPDEYERHDLDLMVEMIDRFHLRRMFDVGANLGIYSFTFSAAAHEGKVVAFEPDAVNSRLFKKTNARNPRHDVVLEEAAVAENPGEAHFFIDNISGVRGSIQESDTAFNQRNYNSPQQSVTVTTTTIDEASERYFSPDFIKIDVEGAEFDVLRGARRTLEHARPILLIEINDDAAVGRVKDLLNEANYHIRPSSPPNYLAYHRQLGMN
jgi:FkbM family methyltransferase